MVLVVVLDPGELHVGQGVGLLLAGLLVRIGEVEFHLPAFLVIKKRHQHIFSPHQTLVNQIDVVFQTVELFACVEGVQAVVFGAEGTDQVVLELFLQADGAFPHEDAIHLSKLFELVDESVLDNGHSPK